MSINVDVHKVAHGSKVAPDDDLRRCATTLAKAKGTNFGTDAIGAIMAKYDTDGDGKFDLNEVRGIAADVEALLAGGGEAPFLAVVAAEAEVAAQELGWEPGLVVKAGGTEQQADALVEGLEAHFGAGKLLW